MTGSVTIRDIEDAVCARFEKIGVTRDILHSPCKERRVARPRQIAMYLCRELTDLSYPQIGRYFGGRDHTTVLSAYRRISMMKEENKFIAGYVRDVMALLPIAPAETVNEQPLARAG